MAKTVTGSFIVSPGASTRGMVASTIKGFFTETVLSAKP